MAGKKGKGKGKGHSAPRQMTAAQARYFAPRAPRPVHRGPGRKSLVARVVGVVRQVGHGLLKVAGPVAIGTGAIVAMAPTVVALDSAAKGGGGIGGFVGSLNAQAGGAWNNTKSSVVIGGVMIGAGVLAEHVARELH